MSVQKIATRRGDVMPYILEVLRIEGHALFPDVLAQQRGLDAWAREVAFTATISQLK